MKWTRLWRATSRAIRITITTMASSEFPAAHKVRYPYHLRTSDLAP